MKCPNCDFILEPDYDSEEDPYMYCSNCDWIEPYEKSWEGGEINDTNTNKNKN